MYNTRVKYLPSTFVRKTKDAQKIGKLDGVATAKEIEALIIEQEKEGYQLFSITPLPGQVHTAVSYFQTVTGFMITFQKQTDD